MDFGTVHKSEEKLKAENKYIHFLFLSYTTSLSGLSTEASSVHIVNETQPAQFLIRGNCYLRVSVPVHPTL